MKLESYDDYQWFLLGLAISSGKGMFDGKGSSSVSVKKTNDGKVLSISYGRNYKQENEPNK